MATLIVDSFAGADAVLDGRSPDEEYVNGVPLWTKHSAGGYQDLQTVSGRVVGVTQSSQAAYYVAAGESDVKLYANLKIDATNGGNAGFIFRQSDNSNYYQARIGWNGSNHTLLIQKVEAGSFSAIVSNVNLGGSADTPMDVRLELSGQNFEVFVDDASQWSTTGQAFNENATNHGVMINSNEAATYIESFSMTDSDGPGVPAETEVVATWVGNMPIGAVEDVIVVPPPSSSAYTLGFNMQDPNYFNSIHVFEDIAKTSTTVSAVNGGGTFDADGNPASGATYMLYNVWGGQKLPVGTYDITHTGAGTANPTSLVVEAGVRQKRIDFTGALPNLSIVRQGVTDTYTPTFSSRANATQAIRFMDPWRTNRREYDGATPWVRVEAGANNNFAHKLMSHVDIANMAIEFSFDPWICIHHLAEDDDINTIAVEMEAILGGTGRKVYVEHSNETWNGAFPQTAYVTSFSQPFSGVHADRTDRIGEIFKAVFAAGEVVCVIGSQLASTGLYGTSISTATRPLNYVDAFAVAPYVGGPPSRNNGPYARTQQQIAQMSTDDIMAEIVRPDWDNRVKQQTLTWKANCDAGGFRLLAYEAGLHLEVAKPKNEAAQAKLDAASQSSQAGVFYAEYLDWWQANVDDLMMIYLDVSTGDGKAWGHKEYELEANSPRWQEVIDRMLL